MIIFLSEKYYKKKIVDKITTIAKNITNKFLILNLKEKK